MIPFNIIILVLAFGALFPFTVADFDGNKEVGFYIYTRDDAKEGSRVELGDVERLEESGFDPTIQTKVIVHGYDDSYLGDEMQETKDALLDNDEYNVILVDWENLAKDFDAAVQKARKIGHHIGKFIKFLNQTQSTDVNDVHVIAHSLGAQVSSFISDVVKDPKLGRLTGLDPANAEPYKDADPKHCLDSDDAAVVDIFHTSTVGVQKPIGHVDFYPNGGRNQISCEGEGRAKDLCDHVMSWKYFIDSIYHPENYMAVKCNSVEEAKEGTCEGDTVQLGEFMQPTTTGIFYKAFTT